MEFVPVDILLGAGNDNYELSLVYDGDTLSRFEISDTDWISLTTTASTSEIQINVKVQINPNATQRTGTVTAYDGDDNEAAVLTITQEANGMEINPQKVNFTAAGGMQSISIKTGGVWTITPNTQNPEGITATRSSDTEIIVSATPNTERNGRTASFAVRNMFYPNFSGNFAVTQDAATGETHDMGMVEIWKDFEIEIPATSDTIEYTIELTRDAKTIYVGKAYKLPDATAIKINPNRIVENYLYAEFPENFVNTTVQDINAAKDVKITVVGGDVYYYIAVNNWTYDNQYDISKIKILNDPPYPYADTRQYCPRTTIIRDRVTTTWETVAESDLYLPANKCSQRYVIYYSNLYGGWDAMLFTGKYTRSENYTRDTAKYSVINTQRKHYTTQYNINVTEKWKLKSAYLAPAECESMDNVLTSNLVYLHDLDTDEIYPVNITDTSFTEKNEYDKRRTRYYEITVERAIEMNRK